MTAPPSSAAARLRLLPLVLLSLAGGGCDDAPVAGGAARTVPNAMLGTYDVQWVVPYRASDVCHPRAERCSTDVTSIVVVRGTLSLARVLSAELANETHAGNVATFAASASLQGREHGAPTVSESACPVEDLACWERLPASPVQVTVRGDADLTYDAAQASLDVVVEFTGGVRSAARPHGFVRDVQFLQPVFRPPLAGVASVSA